MKKGHNFARLRFCLLYTSQPVDTTGAGDIFGGSVLARLLQLNKPLSAMDDADLRQATRFACCAASLSTERFGGISSVVPLADVLRCLADESV